MVFIVRFLSTISSDDCIEVVERHGYKLYRIPYWLDEEDIRTEISNILKGNPTYPNIPNIEHDVTQPKPRK